MKNESNKTLIGAFIVGAFLLAAIAVFLFGGGGILKASTQHVLYFTGSVKGLSLGAPVQLKGVTMGKVTKINLVYSPISKAFFTQVVIDLPQESVKISDDIGKPSERAKVLRSERVVEELIQVGLRAKLDLQSFVTGQLLVAFDFYPDTPINLMNFQDDLQELPTLPSDMEALSKTLESIDFEGILSAIQNAAVGIESLATSPALQKTVTATHETLDSYRELAVNANRQLTRLSGEVSGTLAEARQLMKTTDDQVAPVAESITETAADIQQAVGSVEAGLEDVLNGINQGTVALQSALSRTEALLANMHHLSGEDSTLLHRLDETLAEVSRAARAMAVLADYMGRHPESLLKGKPNPEQ
jgi:paraquat-inducible protein B